MIMPGVTIQRTISTFHITVAYDASIRSFLRYSPGIRREIAHTVSQNMIQQTTRRWLQGWPFMYAVHVVIKRSAVNRRAKHSYLPCYLHVSIKRT